MDARINIALPLSSRCLCLRGQPRGSARSRARSAASSALERAISASFAAELLVGALAADRAGGTDVTGVDGVLARVGSGSSTRTTGASTGLGTVRGVGAFGAGRAVFVALVGSGLVAVFAANGRGADAVGCQAEGRIWTVAATGA